MTGHRTVRIACVGLLALGLLVAVTASSSAAANLAVTVTGPATNPTAGDGNPFELTVKTKNNDAGDSGNVTTTLTLPSGVTLDPSTPVASNCSTVVLGKVQCGRGVIAATATDTFTVDLQADHTVSGVVDVRGSSADDGSLTSNTSHDLVTVDTSSDLALSDVATPGLSQGVDPQDAVAGGTIDYALKVTNGGPSDNQGFTVTDQLPEGATFVSSNPSGCTSSPGGAGLGDLVSCVESVVTTPSNSTSVTIHADISASEPAQDGWADSATIASSQTTDPTPGDTASQSVSLVTSSDLALTESAAVPTGENYEPSTQNGMVVAGDQHAYSYTLTVTNGGPSDNQGFVVQDVLPHGASFDSADSTEGCVGDSLNPETVKCTESSVTAPGGHPSFTIAATTASSEPANAAYSDHASIFSSLTTDHNNANDTSSNPLDLVERADLTLANFAVSPVQTPPIYANSKPAQNTVAYTFTVANGGPSDGHAVIVTSTLETGKLVGASYGWCVDPCSPSSAQPYPSGGKLSIGTAGTVPNGQTIDVIVTATADTNLRFGQKNGSESVVAGFDTTSATQDYVSSNNSAADSPGVAIDTVPTAPLSQFAIPGTSNAILTWEKPASDGGKPIQNYQITVTPSGGSTTTLPLFAASNPHTTACAESPNHDCYQLTVTGLPPITGGYSFGIAALNDVGTGDTATAQATTSADARNAVVPTNTSQTLTSCTTASPTSPTCIQYVIPSGNGGVFGAQGNFTFTNANTTFCGGVACIGGNGQPNTAAGAVNLGSFFGYTDFKHPILEIITWDFSTFTLAEEKNPGSILLYYEKAGATQAGVLPKCTNQSYALSPAQASSHPFTGSACLKKVNILGSKQNPAANGDIQFQVNLTSDSDGLAGHH